jgi:hypothetical protein
MKDFSESFFFEGLKLLYHVDEMFMVFHQRKVFFVDKIKISLHDTIADGNRRQQTPRQFAFNGKNGQN